MKYLVLLIFFLLSFTLHAQLDTDYQIVCEPNAFVASGSNYSGNLINPSDQSAQYLLSGIDSAYVLIDAKGDMYEITTVSVNSPINVTVLVKPLDTIPSSSAPAGKGYVAAIQDNGKIVVPPQNELGLSPLLISRIHTHNAIQGASNSVDIEVYSVGDSLFFVAGGDTTSVEIPTGTDGVTTAGVWDEVNKEFDFTVSGASNFSVPFTYVDSFTRISDLDSLLSNTIILVNDSTTTVNDTIIIPNPDGGNDTIVVSNEVGGNLYVGENGIYVDSNNIGLSGYLTNPVTYLIGDGTNRFWTLNSLDYWVYSQAMRLHAVDNWIEGSNSMVVESGDNGIQIFNASTAQMLFENGVNIISDDIKFQDITYQASVDTIYGRGSLGQLVKTLIPSGGASDGVVNGGSVVSTDVILTRTIGADVTIDVTDLFDDETVVLTDGTNIDFTGTYPNFSADLTGSLFTVGTNDIVVNSTVDVGGGIEIFTRDVGGTMLSDVFDISLTGGGASPARFTLSAKNYAEDALVGWDDSENKMDYITLGSNLQLTGTELNTTGLLSDITLNVSDGTTSTAINNNGTITFSDDNLILADEVAGTVTISLDNSLGSDGQVIKKVAGVWSVGTDNIAGGGGVDGVVDVMTLGSSPNYTLTLERTEGLSNVTENLSALSDIWTIEADAGTPEAIQTTQIHFRGETGISTNWDAVNKELEITNDAPNINQTLGWTQSTGIATLSDGGTFTILPFDGTVRGLVPDGTNDAALFLDGSGNFSTPNYTVDTDTDTKIQAAFDGGGLNEMTSISFNTDDFDNTGSTTAAVLEVNFPANNDNSSTNEGSLTTSLEGTNLAAINSNTSGSTPVSILGTNGLLVTEAGNQISFSGANFLQSEVDGLTTNEGSLTVGAGGATSSTIASNTSGSTDVTISVTGGLAISEASNTITLDASGIAGESTADGAGTTINADAVDVDVKNSIVIDSDFLQLVNDANTPGNDKYYGTNVGGTKGWFDLPAISDTRINVIADGAGGSNASNLTFSNTDFDNIGSALSPSMRLADQSITEQEYGDANNVPVFTVNDRGIITVISEVAVAGGADQNLGWTQSTGILTLTNSTPASITIDPFAGVAQGLVPTGSSNNSALFLDGQGNWSTPNYTVDTDTDTRTDVDVNGTEITADATAINFSTNFTGTQDVTEADIDLSNTGVTNAVYGSTTSVPEITVDVKGRITNAVDRNIVFPTNNDNDSGNEGLLNVLAGTGANSIIQSNTTGSNDITIAVTGGIAISENTGTDVITLDGSAFIQSETAQTLSDAVQGSGGRVTLSNGGGDFDIVGTAVTYTDGLFTIDSDGFEENTDGFFDAVNQDQNIVITEANLTDDLKFDTEDHTIIIDGGTGAVAGTNTALTLNGTYGATGGEVRLLMQSISTSVGEDAQMIIASNSGTTEPFNTIQGNGTMRVQSAATGAEVTRVEFNDPEGDYRFSNMPAASGTASTALTLDGSDNLVLRNVPASTTYTFEQGLFESSDIVRLGDNSQGTSATTTTDRYLNFNSTVGLTMTSHVTADGVYEPLTLYGLGDGNDDADVQLRFQGSEDGNTDAAFIRLEPDASNPKLAFDLEDDTNGRYVFSDDFPAFTEGSNYDVPLRQDGSGIIYGADFYRYFVATEETSASGSSDIWDIGNYHKAHFDWDLGSTTGDVNLTINNACDDDGFVGYYTLRLHNAGAARTITLIGLTFVKRDGTTFTTLDVDASTDTYLAFSVRGAEIGTKTAYTMEQ